jgi:HAD superfamily hydrolase (TIGR01484 family)
LSLSQLLEQFPEQVMGTLAQPCRRFPLLLKFLDVRDLLSVQVHPSDEHAGHLPEGETGKTEAWVVLQAEPESRIYGGLRPGTTPEGLRRAVKDGTLADDLACFIPRAGDAVLVPAGTVHALGLGVVVFEVQQNSDVTFRLYDWDHVDRRTGQPRPLQVDQAIACTDFAQGALRPAVPVPEGTTPSVRERLLDCDQFRLWRLCGLSPFTVGARGVPRILVCIAGAGAVEYGDAAYEVRRGDVMLLPAVSRCVPVQAERSGKGAGGGVTDRDTQVSGSPTLKRLVVFDLDGTLAASKSAPDAEMVSLLHDLLGIVRVAVISGGDWSQFVAQLLSHLPTEQSLANLSLLPTCGTQFFEYTGEWNRLYSEDLTVVEKEKIVGSLDKALVLNGLKSPKLWGQVIEDRGSQVTMSALGQEAPLEDKRRWDPDFSKRKKLKVTLDALIPEFSVRIGGATSIDVTKPGIDKAYGITKLRDILGVSLAEMIFIGDALFPGGNDYPAQEAGVVSIPVRGPDETKLVIKAISACLDGEQNGALSGVETGPWAR